MVFFIQSLAMQITQDTAVTLKYQIATPAGKPLDSGHLSYLHGGYDNIFPKVEAALDGQAVGFAIKLDLSADDAFGERDESLVRVIPKSEFPPGVKVGGQLQAVRTLSVKLTGNPRKPLDHTCYLTLGPRQLNIEAIDDRLQTGQQLTLICKERPQ